MILAIMLRPPCCALLLSPPCALPPCALPPCAPPLLPPPTSASPVAAVPGSRRCALGLKGGVERPKYAWLRPAGCSGQPVQPGEVSAKLHPASENPPTRLTREPCDPTPSTGLALPRPVPCLRWPLLPHLCTPPTATTTPTMTTATASTTTPTATTTATAVATSTLALHGLSLPPNSPLPITVRTAPRPRPDGTGTTHSSAWRPVEASWGLQRCLQSPRWLTKYSFTSLKRTKMCGTPAGRDSYFHGLLPFGGTFEKLCRSQERMPRGVPHKGAGV